MTLLSTSIERLCALGCNITINYSDYPLTSLERFASIISRTNGTLTIKKCSKALSTSLERLAAIGKEHVMFDLTE